MAPAFLADTVPWFRGQITLHHRDPTDISALSDLLELDATYHLPPVGGLDAQVEPLVAETIDFPEE